MAKKLCMASQGPLSHSPGSAIFLAKTSEKLLKWGFEVNPYDWCIANKMINRKQTTVLWHVDGMKISHVDENVVTQVLDLMSDEFATEALLSISKGRRHQYLGMQIEYTNRKQVQITL